MTKILKTYSIILPSNRHTSSNQNSRWVHSLRRVIAYHFDKPQNHQYLNDHNLLSELKLEIVTRFGPKYDLDNAKKKTGTYIVAPIWYYQSSGILELLEIHLFTLMLATTMVTVLSSITDNCQQSEVATTAITPVPLMQPHVQRRKIDETVNFWKYGILHQGVLWAYKVWIKIKTIITSLIFVIPLEIMTLHFGL